MLKKLSIKNYALIEDISIDFYDGFTTITGETGAGKSILLGGLGLILGNRADTKSLKNSSKKCVIEGEFDISSYDLKSFFLENDIDFEENTILRRELLPSGKSRAFINDTPVRLDILSKLHTYLIDIHSQHQTLLLGEAKFQKQVVDSLAENESLLQVYKDHYNRYNQQLKELEALEEKINKEKQQFDYHHFLLDELLQANFSVGDQEELEESVSRLNNVELIQQSLSEAYNLLSKDELGILNQLHYVKENLSKIQQFSEDYKTIYGRLNTVYIELKDIESTLDSLQDVDVFSSLELEDLNNRLQLLYNLFQKHHVNSIQELDAIKEDLEEKVLHVNNASELLEDKKQSIQKTKKLLIEIANKLSKSRTSVVPVLTETVESILYKLGMSHAQFDINISTDSTVFYPDGQDRLEFLFSANKGNKLAPLKQVASGGEMSRIMLAIKAVMSQKTKLPSLIFDEIDTGVSGEVALAMADIMKKMAENMQIISITHLPQIAAKGNKQLKVYKVTGSANDATTKTHIKQLNTQERVLEIAEMLGGKMTTDTAINHAKQLLD